MSEMSLVDQFVEEVGPPIRGCRVCSDPTLLEFVNKGFALGYGSTKMAVWLQEHGYPDMTINIVTGHKVRKHHLHQKEPANVSGRTSTTVSRK